MSDEEVWLTLGLRPLGGIRAIPICISPVKNNDGDGVMEIDTEESGHKKARHPFSLARRTFTAARCVFAPSRTLAVEDPLRSRSTSISTKLFQVPKCHVR